MKKKKKVDFYDQEEIQEQREYENNPLAQIIKKEQIDLIRSLAYIAKDKECEYFHYLLKFYVQGFSLREIAKEEKIYPEKVRARMEQALRYLKREVVRYTNQIDRPE